jgi:DNA ligase (NAD+)
MLQLDSGPLEYVAELKFDGVALSLVYKGGKFVRAVTRFVQCLPLIFGFLA